MSHKGGQRAVGMYRFAWAFFAASAGAAGVWASLEEFALRGVLALLLLVATCVSCIALTWTGTSRRPAWGPAVWTGLGWGAGAVAATGLVVWLGFSGLALIALLTLLSPAVLSRAFKESRQSRRGQAAIARRGRDGCSDPAALDLDRVVGSVDPMAAPESSLAAPWLQRPPESMDDTNLCAAWRMSYVALQRSLPLHARLRIVERRQEFLDELEQRNPRGFSVWLASGARAAGDPTKYIASAQRQGDRHDHP